MKYGKTERISGIVILLALLAIIVPWLMSDPAPRQDRPQPSFVIEQPVEVERRDVPAPERPSSISDPLPSVTGEGTEPRETEIDANPRLPQTDQMAANPSASRSEAAGASESEGISARDPIADLIATNSARGESQAPNTTQSAAVPSSSAQGEWAVQVGSFGEPGNARRLSEQLSNEGFTVYQRERDNSMTTVFVGPYATSEDGESAMSSIKERANVQGLLVRVRD